MSEPTEVPTTLKPTVNSLEEYQAKLAAAKGPVLLDFIMDGCGHCEDETPAFEKLVKDCEGNDATVMRLEITQDWVAPLADKLNVTGTPTAMLAQSVKDLEAGKAREVFELDSEAIRKKLKCAR
jgi:thiol-disulfide isomerase/thioredoxin